MDKGDFTALGIMLVIVVGIVFMMSVTSGQLDEKCKEKYGQSYVGKYETHGADFCVGPNGEAKYIQ